MMSNAKRLEGKVALITGGARGIGKAIAARLAAEGAALALVDVRLEAAQETAAEFAAQGINARAYAANVAKFEEAEATVAAVVADFGRLDILVNNAGIIRREPFVEHSAKNWNDVISINLSTPFFLSQAVVRQMQKQGKGGKIINIASMLSFQGGILVPGYAASKGGIKSLTMLMANELSKDGICVNAIAPGYIATANTAPIRADKKRNKAILDRIPAGRWGTPDDLKGICVFLAAPASDYMTGYTYACDGGWLAR